LKLALWSPSSNNWVIKVIDSDGEVGQRPSLAIDSSNYMHISYYHASSSRLRYARANPDATTIEKYFLTEARGIGNFSSLAVDSAGNPKIAYFDDDYDRLMYISYQNGWKAPQIVDRTGMVGWNPSLVLDTSGNPHISYYDNSHRRLRHAYWTGSFWRISLVDTQGEVGEYSSIALKEGTHPVTAYYDRTNGDLKYAVSTLLEVANFYMPVVKR
jgi:hypothetical protein